MKKYLINIPSLQAKFFLELPIISTKNTRKIGILANIIEWLFINILPALLFLFIFYKNLIVGKELQVQNYLIIFVGILLFLFISKVILFGKQELIDPPFFMAILFFALATTTASVLVSPTNAANTFGAGNFRILAGVSVLLFIITFYLIRVFLQNSNRLKAIMKSILGGFGVYLILLSLVQPNFIDLKIEIATIMVVGVFAILYSLNTAKLKLIKVLILTALIGFILIKFSSITGFDLILGDTLVATLLASVILSVISYITFKNKYFAPIVTTINLAKEIAEKNNWGKIRLLLRNAFIASLIVSPLLLLVIIFVMILRGNYSLSFITADIQSYATSMNYLIDTSKTSFIKLFTGSGYAAYNTSLPLLANLIRMQGLLGSLSYILLGSFGIYQFIKVLGKREFNNKLIIALGFILVIIPILSLITIPSLILCLFWWISLAIFSYMSKSEVKDTIKKVINPLIINGKLNNIKGIWIKVGLIVFTMLIISYSSIAFLNTVKLY